MNFEKRDTTQYNSIVLVRPNVAQILKLGSVSKMKNTQNEKILQIKNDTLVVGV